MSMFLFSYLHFLGFGSHNIVSCFRLLFLTNNFWHSHYLVNRFTSVTETYFLLNWLQNLSLFYVKVEGLTLYHVLTSWSSFKFFFLILERYMVAYFYVFVESIFSIASVLKRTVFLGLKFLGQKLFQIVSR